MNSTFSSPLILFFMLVCFFPFESPAQQNDTTNIKKTIENYIVGWRTADSALLKEAFDFQAGVVLWVDKNDNPEELKSMKLSDLAKKVKPDETYGIGFKIQRLEIVDLQLAIALVKIPRGNNYYIDCLELQKINGDWKIVLKSFVYFKSD